MAAEPFAGLTLARILRPWGRRGGVAAEILTDFPERFSSVREVWLYDGAGGGRNAPRAIVIRSYRLHLGQAIFHFQGVESINDAEHLRGLEVQVPAAERVALSLGRYYISDLIGCSVREWDAPDAAAELGTVREVQSCVAVEAGRARAPESWLLVVQGHTGEILVPLAAEICTLIDVAARRIEVRLPEGLRELNVASNSEKDRSTDRAAKASARGATGREPA